MSRRTAALRHRVPPLRPPPGRAVSDAPAARPAATIAAPGDRPAPSAAPVPGRSPSNRDPNRQRESARYRPERLGARNPFISGPSSPGGRQGSQELHRSEPASRAFSAFRSRRSAAAAGLPGRSSGAPLKTGIPTAGRSRSRHAPPADHQGARTPMAQTAPGRSAMPAGCHGRVERNRDPPTVSSDRGTPLAVDDRLAAHGLEPRRVPATAACRWTSTDRAATGGEALAARMPARPLIRRMDRFRATSGIFDPTGSLGRPLPHSATRLRTASGGRRSPATTGSRPAPLPKADSPLKLGG